MRDVTTDAGLVRALLREQHPDLAELPLRPVDGGWDNALWRLGDGLAVRLPRTERAPGLLRTEHRWLPGLAARLPLPVPTPLRPGHPGEVFPRFWTVAAWVPGTPADIAPVRDGDRSADALAAFLTALHHPAPAGAPVSPTRGVPLAAVAGDFVPHTGGIFGDLAPAVRALWDDAVAAPAWHGPPVWLHGDLHPANVVTADGALTGVLDFGEMGAGDPATDLAAGWTLLPEGAAVRFHAAYGGPGGGVDAATLRRARGWALHAAAGLISVGLAGERGLPGGKPTWLPAGRAAAARVVASA